MTTLLEKVTLVEASFFLECSIETVLAELRAGRLPGVKLGHSWVIPTQAFVQGVNLRAAKEAMERAEQKPTPVARRERGGQRRSLVAVK